MESQLSEKQIVVSRGIDSNPALHARMYNAFLQMRQLLEYHSPVWYSEDLHNRINAIIRDYSPRAKSRRRRLNGKDLREQELVRRSSLISSKSSRRLASEAIA